MLIVRIYTTIISLFITCISSAQTLGGSAAYNFLKLSTSPILAGSGGVNTSYRTNEVGLTANNPALLNPALNGQLNCSFTLMPGETKAYSLTGAYQYQKLNTTLGGHIFFIDYGSVPQTDAAGNISGEFRPVDFVVQLEAARKYEERWSYGGSLKFINSNYQVYKSSAIAADVSVLYWDSLSGFSASLLARNMGFQLKSYAGGNEDLPFDLQIGITKRLKNSPLGFSVAAHHLHHFDINYNDEAFNRVNNLSANSSFSNKLLNHIVVASHIYIGNHLEGTIGYNHLRQSELKVGTAGNGLAGFSMGVRVMFQKLQVEYARANYQKTIALNQFGLTLQLKRF